MDTREADRQVIEKPPVKGTNGQAAHVAGQTAHAPEPQKAEPAREEQASPRRRIFLIAGVAIAVVLLLVFGIPWLSYALSHQGTDDAVVDADVVAVTSKIPEKIDQILVNTNDRVHKGQLLIVLDNKDELDRLSQAQAQYDLAVANQRTVTVQNQGGVTAASGTLGTSAAQVPVAQSGVDQAQSSLQVAISEVPAAQQSYAKAQADYNRTASLVASGDEAAQQLDTARANIAEAQAQFQTAKDQVSAAQANVAAARARVGAAQAGVTNAQGGVTTAQGKLQQSADPSQVEAAKAQLELAKQNLAYTHIYSPIDGYVGQKNVEVGQTVSAGTSLLTLIPDHIYITANYKETQMGNMHVGQPVDIKVDAYKGVTFRGHVESINPASQNTYALVPAQNATGNFVKVTQRIPVRIAIDDQRPDMPLRPGMSVETAVNVK